jgi:hypothetical protein
MYYRTDTVGSKTPIVYTLGDIGASNNGPVTVIPSLRHYRRSGLSLVALSRYSR